jgi:hypothetical protein
MATYMLFLHDNVDAFTDMDQDQMMAIIKEYTAWTEKMQAEGRFLGGNKLTDEPGRNMATKDGELVVHDGPFTETKELLGGYMMVSADSYDQAVELAATCPHVKYGRIEVREVEDLH